MILTWLIATHLGQYLIYGPLKPLHFGEVTAAVSQCWIIFEETPKLNRILYNRYELDAVIGSSSLSSHRQNCALMDNALCSTNFQYFKSLKLMPEIYSDLPFNSFNNCRYRRMWKEHVHQADENYSGRRVPGGSVRILFEGGSQKPPTSCL